MRPLLLLALLGCLSTAHAVETVHRSANGGGDCPTKAERAPDAAPVDGIEGDTDAATATPGAPAGSAGTAVRPRSQVRWHSLIPGMVR